MLVKCAMKGCGKVMGICSPVKFMTLHCMSAWCASIMMHAYFPVTVNRARAEVAMCSMKLIVCEISH